MLCRWNWRPPCDRKTERRKILSIVVFRIGGFHLRVLGNTQMFNTLDQDVYTIKEWLRGAWRSLADSSLTAFEKREIRNYMKDAEIAVRAGLKRIADRERASRRTERVTDAGRHLDFRIIRLDA
jgi:hypothetical protein